MFMLNILSKIEAMLPDLLRKDGWNSLYIDYHKPFVERLWRDVDGVRVSLHRIQTCSKEEALFHKHPWPSAMRIVEGAYEMGVGYSEGDSVPPVVSTLLLPEGSAYEMIEPNGWHYVRPLWTSTLSLMVNGMPWMPSTSKSKYELKPLSSEQHNALLIDFCQKFC